MSAVNGEALVGELEQTLWVTPCLMNADHDRE